MLWSRTKPSLSLSFMIREEYRKPANRQCLEQERSEERISSMKRTMAALSGKPTFMAEPINDEGEYPVCDGSGYFKVQNRKR